MCNYKGVADNALFTTDIFPRNVLENLLRYPRGIYYMKTKRYSPFIMKLIEYGVDMCAYIDTEAKSALHDFAGMFV